MSKPYDHLPSDLDDVESLIEHARHYATEAFIHLEGPEQRASMIPGQRRKQMREALAQVLNYLNCATTEFKGIRQKATNAEHDLHDHAGPCTMRRDAPHTRRAIDRHI